MSEIFVRSNAILLSRILLTYMINVSRKGYICFFFNFHFVKQNIPVKLENNQDFWFGENHV